MHLFNKLNTDRVRKKIGQRFMSLFYFKPMTSKKHNIVLYTYSIATLVRLCYYGQLLVVNVVV